MAGTVIDGKKIAGYHEERLKDKIFRMDRPPALHTILVGQDEGSRVYVGVKDRGCKRVGIRTRTHIFHEHISRELLWIAINELNRDVSVDGILLQMPLPEHLDAPKLISSLDVGKDVEGMHPHNLGALVSGKEGVVPCTPGGIITMLEHIECELKGKEVCVVSHSPVVGKPLALMLLNRNATVTVIHEHTGDIREHTKRADVLITAAGVPGLIRGDMIKEGAVVVDVGMNRLKSGELVGDVVFSEAMERAGYITPVPGGVGPMTVYTLLRNTYELSVVNQKKYK